MFIYVLIAIAILSILLSLNSLRKQSHKKEIEEAKENLKKGRVVFQSEKSSEGI